MQELHLVFGSLEAEAEPRLRDTKVLRRLKEWAEQNTTPEQDVDRPSRAVALGQVYPVLVHGALEDEHR